ncbi:hypothetical protein K438DRAFT_2088031 [Mycena galopus ATCC 62051]|nr:hypothetical protein K438DRAFT_2088031 [Mycena galopus ATCC 62051]
MRREGDWSGVEGREESRTTGKYVGGARARFEVRGAQEMKSEERKREDGAAETLTQCSAERGESFGVTLISGRSRLGTWTWHAMLELRANEEGEGVTSGEAQARTQPRRDRQRKREESDSKRSERNPRQVQTVIGCMIRRQRVRRASNVVSATRNVAEAGASPFNKAGWRRRKEEITANEWRFRFKCRSIPDFSERVRTPNMAQAVVGILEATSDITQATRTSLRQSFWAVTSGRDPRIDIEWVTLRVKTERARVVEKIEERNSECAEILKFGLNGRLILRSAKWLVQDGKESAKGGLVRSGRGRSKVPSEQHELSEHQKDDPIRPDPRMQ